MWSDIYSKEVQLDVKVDKPSRVNLLSAIKNFNCIKLKRGNEQRIKGHFQLISVDVRKIK